MEEQFDISALSVVTATRICVTGGSRCGKSTFAQKLSDQLGYGLYQTDSLIELCDWSAASQQAADWLAMAHPFICEGVAMSRALRKRLAQSDEKPCDIVYRLTIPKVGLTPGQTQMNKAENTTWCGIMTELHCRGVEVIYDPEVESLVF